MANLHIEARISATIGVRVGRYKRGRACGRSGREGTGVWETATFIGPSHATKQSIITRSWINVQTATKALANARGLAGIFT